MTSFSDKDDLRFWIATIRHGAVALDWRSRSWDVAIVCHLGPPSKRRCTRREVVATWATYIAQAWQGIANLVMTFGYANGGSLMMRMILSPDGVDDNGDCRAAGRNTSADGNVG